MLQSEMEGRMRREKSEILFTVCKIHNELIDRLSDRQSTCLRERRVNTAL